MASIFTIFHELFGLNSQRAFSYTGMPSGSPWGASTGAPSGGDQAASDGFGFSDNASFDPFLSMTEPPPVPQSTPHRLQRDVSGDSDVDVPMSVVIK